MHSIFVDFCFKLPHYVSATRQWQEYEPPNAKRFVPNRVVREFASNPSNMARPANADKDCSDFTAAEAVARRSQQVRVLGTSYFDWSLDMGGWLSCVVPCKRTTAMLHHVRCPHVLACDLMHCCLCACF
jgi:hypothetical protein